MLNEKLKQLRLSFGLNQVELGKALGVSKQCVSNWENDNIQPSIEMLLRISRFFNISCDELLGLQKTDTVDVSGLSDTELAHIKMLIRDLQELHRV